MKTLLKVFAACLLLITGAWTISAQQIHQTPGLSYADESSPVDDLQGNSNEDKDLTSGTVVDKAGQPLVGATVMIKGTTTGTVTDLDGKCSGGKYS